MRFLIAIFALAFFLMLSSAVPRVRAVASSAAESLSHQSNPLFYSPWLSSLWPRHFHREARRERSPFPSLFSSSPFLPGREVDDFLQDFDQLTREMSRMNNRMLGQFGLDRWGDELFLEEKPKQERLSSSTSSASPAPSSSAAASSSSSASPSLSSPPSSAPKEEQLVNANGPQTALSESQRPSNWLQSPLSSLWEKESPFGLSLAAEDDEKYVLSAQFPSSVGKDHIKVSNKNGVLTVSSERKEEEKEKGYSSSFSSFSSFRLPKNIREDAIQAKLADGKLQIVVPKAKEALRHQEISVE